MTLRATISSDSQMNSLAPGLNTPAPLHVPSTAGVVAKLGVAAFAAFLNVVDAVLDQRQITALRGGDQLVHSHQVVVLGCLEPGCCFPDFGLGVGRRVVAICREQGPGLSGQFLERQRAFVEFTRVVVFAVAGHQTHRLQRAGKLLKNGAPLGHQLVGVGVFGLVVAGT